MTETAEGVPCLPQPLPADRCGEIERLAMDLVQATLGRYAKHIQSGSPDHRVDTAKWKYAKRRDDMKFYRARDRHQPNVFGDLPSETLDPTKWQPLAVVLCVGSLGGSIEDALYGTATPTEISMDARSLLLQDGFTHHRVLQDIKLPTKEDPFHYVGIKWGKRSPSISPLLKPRDILYVEASGFLDVPRRSGGSERVGYVVQQSIEIPELENATSKRAVREQISLCSIFRQRTQNNVDVFATLKTDPGGNLPPKLAAMSAVNSLFAAAGVIDCARKKKLAWLVSSEESEKSREEDIIVLKVRGTNWCCLQCSRSQSSFSSLRACAVCRSTFCSRCIITQKLALGTAALEVKLQSVKVCVGCISSAMWKVDSTRAATDEYVLGSHAHCRGRSMSVLGSDWEDQALEFAQTASSGLSSPVFCLTKRIMDPILTSETQSTVSPDSSPAAASAAPSSCISYSESEDFSIDGTYDEFADDDDLDEEVEIAAPVLIEETTRERLMRQMQELRVQAEMTYYYTKHQSLQLQRAPLDSGSISYCG